MCITNWCGDDVTTAQEWVKWVSEWSGVHGTLEVREVPCSPSGSLANATRRRSLTGPCRTSFPESFRALYEAMTDEDGSAAGPVARVSTVDGRQARTRRVAVVVRTANR